MANFNINIENSEFSIDLVSKIDSECSSMFIYNISSTQGDTITVNLSGSNFTIAKYILNGTENTMNSSNVIVFQNSLTISFAIQNSGIPGVFDNTTISATSAAFPQIALSRIASRDSDASKCISIQPSFDDLIDTPEEKTGQGGKFLSVSQDEQSIEYTDISSAVTFSSQLDPDLEMQEDVGAISTGTTISDLLGLTFTQYIEQQNFPTVEAFVHTNATTSLSGFTTGNVEVGTSIVQTFTATLNRGVVKNGDGTLAGDVVGDISSIDVLNPNSVSNFSSTTTSSVTEDVVTNSYEITPGTNTWRVDLFNFAGTTSYTDNKGGTSTSSLVEIAKADLSRSRVPFSMTGKYYRYHYTGSQNSSPSSSSGIRSLPFKILLSTSNTDEWVVTIQENTQEFSFYVPSGKNFTVIDEGNLNNNITTSFVQENLNVNDAAGNSVSYTKYTIFLGLGGFSSNTDFKITVS